MIYCYHLILVDRWVGLSAIFCKTSALQVDEVLLGGSSQLLLPETSLDPFTHVVPGHSWHRGLLGGATFWLFGMGRIFVWIYCDEVLIFYPERFFLTCITWR